MSLVEQSEKLFNPITFATMVNLRISRENMTQRRGAKVAGISPATMSRVMRGYAPDIETYLRLKRWIEAPAMIAKAVEEGGD